MMQGWRFYERGENPKYVATSDRPEGQKEKKKLTPRKRNRGWLKQNTRVFLGSGLGGRRALIRGGRGGVEKNGLSPGGEKLKKKERGEGLANARVIV